MYARVEAVAKDILDAGFHPVGTAHTHRQSKLGALTAGYVRDFAAPSWGTFGVGGDITGYYVPANLKDSYGSPVSFHVFLRYRGRAGARILTSTSSTTDLFSRLRSSARALLLWCG